ncbi:hypothetical protein ACF91D_25585 [Staphylococcus sp. 231237_7MaSpsaltlick]|uniref:hypothetical protein n=1 Tax=Staphylococcus sp. 231237_7MaSpsaltlick TaxID=3367518 RepID=UPI00370B04E0
MTHYERVEWVLFQSKVSTRELKKVTGISRQTILDYRKGKKDILSNMKYRVALNLEEAFDEVKEIDEKCQDWRWNKETGEDRY